MKKLFQYIILLTVAFISSYNNGMEPEVPVTINHLIQFKDLVTTHTPIASAVPHIKQLTNDKSWSEILSDKKRSGQLISFMSTMTNLVLPSKAIIAAFIGTPGAIAYAQEYIQENPAAERDLKAMLVDTGAWIDVDKNWETQATDVAKSIIKILGNPNVVHEGKTALIRASQNGNIAVAEALIENDAATDIKDPSLTTTPLHEAIIKGNLDIVRLLLSAGAGTDSNILECSMLAKKITKKLDTIQKYQETFEFLHSTL